jgi:hypothetical protein
MAVGGTPGVVQKGYNGLFVPVRDDGTYRKRKRFSSLPPARGEGRVRRWLGQQHPANVAPACRGVACKQKNSDANLA